LIVKVSPKSLRPRTSKAHNNFAFALSPSIAPESLGECQCSSIGGNHKLPGAMRPFSSSSSITFSTAKRLRVAEPSASPIVTW